MDDVLHLILERLDRMDADRDDARHEAKKERWEIVQSIDRLTERVGVQNGRVGRLELWRHGIEAVARAKSWIKPAAIAFVMGGSLATLSWILSHY